MKKTMVGLVAVAALAAGTVQPVQAAASPAAPGHDHTAHFQPKDTITGAPTRPTRRLSTAHVAGDHTISLDVLDRRGMPATTDPDGHPLFVDIWSLSDPDGILPSAEVTDGHAEASLPEGDYAVTAQVGTPEKDGRTSTTLIYLPKVTASGDSSLVLDARTAKPIKVSTDRADARIADVAVMISEVMGGRSNFPAILFGTDLYITPATADNELSYYLQARLTKNGEMTGSPYVYNVGTKSSGIPKDPGLRVKTKDLATVNTQYAGEGKPACAGGHAGIDWNIGVIIGSFVGIGQLPMNRTEYFTPGLDWSMDEGITSADCGFAFDDTDLNGRGDQFPTPGTYTRQWNTAPFGPGAGFLTLRDGDDSFLNVPMLSQDGTDGGASAHLTGRSILRDSNGTKVDISDEPGSAIWPRPAPGTYQLSVDAQRAAPWSDLSTQQNIVWDIAVKDTGTLTLPTVRYRTTLDADNRALPNTQQTITLVPDELQTRTTPSLWVSYDDGTTWQPVTVHTDGAQWTASIQNPASGYVSLRTKVPGTVDQTLIHAYGIR